MKVKSEIEVAQSCLTLSDPMDRSLPGSSVHGIFQARVLEWGAIAFSGQHSLDYRKSKGISEKNIYLCFIDYIKAFDCVDHDKLLKALREMGMLDHFFCLLRNLYAGQEATFRTLYGTTEWFKVEKGV